MNLVDAFEGNIEVTCLVERRRLTRSRMRRRPCLKPLTGIVSQGIELRDFAKKFEINLFSYISQHSRTREIIPRTLNVTVNGSLLSLNNRYETIRHPQNKLDYTLTAQHTRLVNHIQDKSVSRPERSRHSSARVMKRVTRVYAQLKRVAAQRMVHSLAYAVE